MSAHCPDPLNCPEWNPSDEVKRLYAARELAESLQAPVKIDWTKRPAVPQRVETVPQRRAKRKLERQRRAAARRRR